MTGDQDLERRLAELRMLLGQQHDVRRAAETERDEIRRKMAAIENEMREQAERTRVMDSRREQAEKDRAAAVEELALVGLLIYLALHYTQTWKRLASDGILRMILQCLPAKGVLRTQTLASS